MCVLFTILHFIFVFFFPSSCQCSILNMCFMSNCATCVRDFTHAPYNQLYLVFFFLFVCLVYINVKSIMVSPLSVLYSTHCIYLSHKLEQFLSNFHFLDMSCSYFLTMHNHCYRSTSLWYHCQQNDLQYSLLCHL